MVMRRVIATVSAAALAASALAFVGATAQAEETAPTVGDCLVIDKNSFFAYYGDATVVPCEDDHQSEVYEVVAYPAGEGAPSTIADRAWELFGEECSYAAREAYLGVGDWFVPPRVGGAFRLPSDEQWENGADWVLCITYRPDAKGAPSTYSGKLPDLIADSPSVDLLNCLNAEPKSGKWNRTVPCSKKAKWLMIIGVGFKGKPSGTYPADVQKKADSLCAKNAKKLIAKGAKAVVKAGLGPKKDMAEGEIFGECFLAFKDWNGKFS